MDPRIVNLLGSFIGGTSAYTLARLEYAARFAASAPPPLLERLPDASEATLRGRWERVETQLAAIMRWLKQREASAGSEERSDPSFVRLRRTARELDQYARALRWFLTVTGGES